MREVIDLISSDPALPGSPKPQHGLSKTWQAAVGLAENSGLISSDSIVDIAGFGSDANIEKPPKKRRFSDERRLTLRQTTGSNSPARQDSVLSFSDDDSGIPPSNPKAQRGYRERDAEESDPIVFTSSAPQTSRGLPTTLPARAQKQDEVITLDDDDDDWPRKGQRVTSRGRQDDIEDFTDPFGSDDFGDAFGLSGPGISVSNAGFSSKTAALLSTLANAPNRSKVRSKAKSGSRPHEGKSTMGDTLNGHFSDGVEQSSEAQRPAKKKTKLSAEEKQARAKARAEEKAQRDFERQLQKQREKEEKQKLKEEKAKEKQLAADIAEVNKLKVDKKESVAEMIVDLSSSLKDTSVGTQAVEFMKRLKVEHHFFSAPVPDVVKWRRKMNATYNETVGHWEPAPFRIVEEKHLLCLVLAQDFVDMIVDPPPKEKRQSLESHVLKLKSAYPGYTIIYLIEGLHAWMNKNKNARNRVYVAEVLRQSQPESNSTSESAAPRRGRKPKRKPETTPPVDNDMIEDALLELQVTHSCFIHHTAAPLESAEWIKNFTEHVSTNLYRWERINAYDASFCMESGQVKPGEDKLDTFVKMLQEVNRVTASMAYGISARYPSVADLVRGMQVHGPSMLEDVKKSANRTGALADARVGPAASKRLYKVFTGLDPTSTDI